LKSEENLKLFEMSPETYVPQWGGFCSYGIAEETWWTKSSLGPEGNPDVWQIIDGKLHFFRDSNLESKFMSGDIESEIISGNEIWDGWFNTTIVFNTGCFWYDKYSDTGIKKIINH